nr:son of sevenless [Tanacetum cinerariifolium]
MDSSNGSTPKMTQIPDQENNVTRSDHVFQTTSALEILRETVRILRYNLSGFMAIGAFLICPVSAVLLSNVLVDQGLVKRVVIRLLLVAKSCGLPLSSFVERFCFKFAESGVSAVMCFPLYITLLLISKAAVVYSVDCTYSRKMFDASKCYVIVRKIWKRILATYLLVCTVVIGSLTLFLVLIAGVSSLLSVIGFTPDLNVYMVIIIGLFFSVFFANAVIICDLSMVISVLEDVSGAEALLRSSVLIRGQTQVGLMIFLGSTIGMAFIEGLFEHRVKTLSYGDGSSRIWEGPLLVVMYSFVVLINFMMSTVFYFSCKSYSLENDSSIECQSVLEALTVSPVASEAQ